MLNVIKFPWNQLWSNSLKQFSATTCSHLRNSVRLPQWIHFALYQWWTKVSAPSTAFSSTNGISSRLLHTEQLQTVPIPGQGAVLALSLLETLSFFLPLSLHLDLYWHRVPATLRVRLGVWLQNKIENVLNKAEKYPQKSYHFSCSCTNTAIFVSTCSSSSSFTIIRLNSDP